MSQAPKHRQLPDKEAKLFKELLMQYELKGYKKGLKAADTILKKFPNHGETLAIKALTLHSSLPMPLTASAVPKQAEAEEMARLAVKKDITSHITWHVLGILAKNRKDWDEASRAFGMARKQDPDNIPLIRDATSLSTHTRQYEAAMQARHHYLTLRPQTRQSWLGLMVSHHLNGDPGSALDVYDAFISCVKQDGGTGPEKAQVALYVVKLCMEAGRYDEGLDRLERGFLRKVISPRGEATQLKAEMLKALGRMTEAEETYRTLLQQNPDNLEYYRGYLQTKELDVTKELDEAAREKVLEVLAGFAEMYPKSSPPKRMALDIAQGEDFVRLIRPYLIAGLERGIPSLFVDVKGLYRNAEKLATVGQVVEEIIAKLEKDAGLHDDDSISPPTVLLWAYYFLALHLSHPAHPKPAYKRSLDLLDTALVHTPTLPEIYMARAMVLKRAGDPAQAARAMEDARLLDGQDRFLNVKAAKYWLRAGDVKKAEELLAMFTKKDMPPSADLTDLQCLWFLQEEGDAYNRTDNLAMALKRYQALATVFQDYEDDQYDFHTYCLRRMTFSAYIHLMKYEDQLRSHPAYFKGALAAIEVYTRLHDDPELAVEKLTPEEEAERKRAAKKAQKAEQKAKKAAASAGDSKKEEPPVPDADPDGQALLKTETPLEDALKLWQPLRRHAARRIETWLAGYEIYSRKKLYLAALRCLNEASSLDREDETLHRQILNFNRIVSSAADLPEPIQSTIKATLPNLLTSSPSEFNQSFLSRHATSAPHILAAAQGSLEFSPPASAEDVHSILLRLFDAAVPPSVAVLSSAANLLKKVGAEQTVLEDFRSRCGERVPLALAFLSAEEKAKRAKKDAGEEAVNGVKADV